MMNEIRDRVNQDRYEVDTEAVARALVERLVAGRAVTPRDREE